MLVVVSALALVVDLLGGVDPATFLALLCHDLELVLELGSGLVFLDNVVVVQLLALHHLDVDAKQNNPFKPQAQSQRSHCGCQEGDQGGARGIDLVIDIPTP